MKTDSSSQLRNKIIVVVRVIVIVIITVIVIAIGIIVVIKMVLREMINDMGRALKPSFCRISSISFSRSTPGLEDVHGWYAMRLHDQLSHDIV